MSGELFRVHHDEMNRTITIIVCHLIQFPECIIVCMNQFTCTVQLFFRTLLISSKKWLRASCSLLERIKTLINCINEFNYMLSRAVYIFNGTNRHQSSLGLTQLAVNWQQKLKQTSQSTTRIEIVVVRLCCVRKGLTKYERSG